ncbi:hypothetical protein ACKU27_13675 [Sphingobium yanoikuyae]|uniref:hypothetical protein n=1 Tax=Sphingobium yanoikuyae TaxID=13690 RepID=UPI003B913AA6
MDVHFHNFRAAPPRVVAALAKLDSSHLGAIAAAAIQILDQRDGDSDFEGEPLEAASDDGRRVSSICPIYGINQSDGPTNSAEADLCAQVAA